MLDALRQVVHLRAYAQKKPIDEYKHEAFAMFERMLGADPRGRDRHARARRASRCSRTSCRRLPDFLTHHIDPFTGDDDTRRHRRRHRRDPVAAAAAADCRSARHAGATTLGEVAPPASRNAPCPCGSGRKYKHCHGASA